MNFFLFTILAFFWGGSFVAIKFVVEEMNPSFGAFIRVSLATLILFLVFYFRGSSFHIPRGIRLKIVLAGLFQMGVPFSLLFWGEQHVSAGLAGIINGTVPIWTFILAFSLFKTGENLSTRKLMGVALGLVGTVIIFLPSLQIGTSKLELLSTGAILLMAFSYAIGATLTKQVFNESDTSHEANLICQHVVGSVYLLLLSLYFDPWSVSTVMSASFTDKFWHAVIAVVYLGVFSTAAAMVIYYRLISQWGAVRAAGVTYFIPLISLTLDYAFNGNVPNLSEMVGVLIILLGVFLLQSSRRSSVLENKAAQALSR